MPRVKGIDHLVIRVSDPGRSKDFYGKVLCFLGFELKYEYGDQCGWSNGRTLFWIGEADAEGKQHPHRIGNIGFHHYAFELGRRRDVDDLHACLVEHGFTHFRLDILPIRCSVRRSMTVNCSSAGPGSMPLPGREPPFGPSSR